MTPWSIPAMLLVGIAFGPHGLDLVSPTLLTLLDPAIAMALATLGTIVGLSFDLQRPHRARVFAASGIRTITIAAIVAATALVILSYWIGHGSPWWIVPLALGTCAAVSEPAAHANTDDLLMIVMGGVAVVVLRGLDPSSPVLLAPALVVIAGLVAIAGWMLVGQTNSEAEQHVFVVGSLLLAGGAATYLALSALLVGVIVGLTWNLAGRVAKARILRDLYYFQHPLVVLVLIAAGAAAQWSVDALALGAIFVSARVIARPVGSWLAGCARRSIPQDNSHVAAGLVGIAIAFDTFRSAEPDVLGMMLGAVVAGTIVSTALGLFVPASEGSA